jgi:hypothetical protein
MLTHGSLTAQLLGRTRARRLHASGSLCIVSCSPCRVTSCLFRRRSGCGAPWDSNGGPLKSAKCAGARSGAGTSCAWVELTTTVCPGQFELAVLESVSKAWARELRHWPLLAKSAKASMSFPPASLLKTRDWPASIVTSSNSATSVTVYSAGRSNVALCAGAAT